MKKFLFILSTLILLVSNLSISIFADDSEIDNNDSEINENIDNDEIKQNENEIIEIKNDINNIKSSITSLENRQSGSYGLITDFSFMDEYILDFYINNFNNIVLMYKTEASNAIIYILKENINYLSITPRNQNNDYNISFSHYYNYNVYNKTLTYNENTINTYFLNDYDSNEYIQGWYKLLNTDLSVIYSLTPYSVNILNNGLNNYTITPSDYDLGYYPSGSTITITYDNSINDFFGYFDNQGNLLSSNTTYTFDITQDTNIVINYRAKDGIDYYPYMIYIILLLTIIFLSTFIKGGLLS